MKLCVAWITLAKLMTLLTGRSKKAATALLRDEIRKQDFAKPVASRVSRFFWTCQSLSHFADSASNLSCVTGFSPRANCWFPHVLCYVLCTAQRFHVE